jgi:prepilin-type N-terminal cleavage/methylation domain-containing protein
MRSQAVRHVSHVSRRAFTLVELLVVIAIIGTLVGLLLPAVQAARESSRRSTCMSNAKQIALAVHSYENARRRYPSGTSAEMIMDPDSSQNAPGYDYRNWVILLLPHLEEQQLYADVLRTMPSVRGYADTPAPFTAVPGCNKIMSVFNCPSDPNSSKLKLVAADSPGRGFYTNYHGVAGSTKFNPRGLLSGGNATTRAEPTATGSEDGGTRLNGIFFSRSKVGPKDVTDGTSKTLLIAEGVNVPHTTPDYWLDTRGWVWYCGWLGCTLVSTENTPNTSVGDRLRYCTPHPRAPCAGLAGVPQAGPNDNLVQYARSYHPGVYAGFADGSVRFYTETVNAAVWAALGTRAGGELITNDE